MSDSSLINNSQADDAFTVMHPWVRHYQQGVPVHLDIPDRPLTSLLDTTASQYPHHTALIYYGAKTTYAQFSNLANRFAIALLHLGIKPGDRVALALPNIPQYPIAFFGALRAGAVVVPTNPLYTEREMQHQLSDAGARILVMLDSFYPIVRTIRQKTALEHIIITSPADYLPPVLRALYPLSQRREQHPEPALTEKELHNDPMLHALQSLLKPPRTGEIEQFQLPVPIHSTDLAVLQYTGGTTGLAKGAMLTHRNLLANAYQTWSWIPNGKQAQEIALCVAPFFHAYGLTVGMTLSIKGAATMILLPRFKAKDVLDAIRRHHPSMMPGIPTMYIALLRETGKHTTDMSSIKYCISGAAPLPAQVQKDFEEQTHGKLVEGYGLSEAAPVTHCNPLSDQNRNGSIGLPLPAVEAAILNPETGEPAPIGEIGEIVVKGPNIMQGYWQREQETQAMFINGWMRTGDIGKMDADGYFYVVERAKDMIIASGFNVYPREVEEILFHHPFVEEVAVVGLPDEYRGETVVAFVVLKAGVEGSEETRQQLLTFCKQELTPYKVPKRLEFRSYLPKSLVGKVLKRELRTASQV